MHSLYYSCPQSMGDTKGNTTTLHTRSPTYVLEVRTSWSTWRMFRMAVATLRYQRTLSKSCPISSIMVYLGIDGRVWEDMVGARV